MLKDKILNKESGLVFYSLTPPKINNDLEKIHAIAQKQLSMLNKANIDGLILYDIQDETDRTDAERPFAFISTVQPDMYAKEFLKELNVPKIVYKSIANSNEDDFNTWLKNNSDLEFSVFVGASSQQQVLKNNFSLSNAYRLRKDNFDSLILGGVTIPERHVKSADEHLRIFKKVQNGCSFFVSQCVYSPNNSKNLLSDYFYASMESEIELSPMIFTLAPCGSLKTLKFMEWLGIEVPKWLYNDLKHSNNILDKSVNVCKNIAFEMIEYAQAKNIPFGFNIESVSIKKEEIEASELLLNEVLSLLKK
jgi:hypothetical protein